jgi:hypothetical protein
MNKNPSFVTAAEAGIPEMEQTKIALELILSQGGVAVMQQIYDAIEKKLPESLYLSPQGKNSLRRVVNTRAVNDGYIHRYDKNNPGWRITEKGIIFIRQELRKHIGDIKFTARASVNFNLAMKEVRNLLDYSSDLEEDQTHGNRSLEVFKRTSVILIVTAWESFIEDILGLHINHRLDTARIPADIPKAFNAIAHAWYDAIINRYDQHPRPNDFTKWTGDNWKGLIREKLQEDLSSLNTPKSKNVGELAKRYLGADITQNWNLARMPAQAVSNKLDEIIELRGEISHRIVNYFEAKSGVRQIDLMRNINFIERLGVRTEEVLDSIQ